MASISATTIWKSTSSDQEIESNNFSGSSIAGASGIRFTSADPTATNFSGNNVNGTLEYTVGAQTYTIQGVVSRLFKSGSTIEGFYFTDTGSDYALGNGETTFAYILVWPTRESAFSSSPGTYGTSSDPVDSALNSLQDAQPLLNNITQNDADLSVTIGQTVTYTFTFSGDISDGSFTSADIINAGTATISYGSITETSPGVFSVPITVQSAGTIQLGIAEGAVISSVSGPEFDSSNQTLDNETLATAAAPTISAVTAEDNGNLGQSDSSVVEGGTLKYGVTLSGSSASATEYTFTLGGTAAATDYEGIANFTFSNGVTYDSGTGKITVPAGVTSFSVLVDTTDDAAIESAETLTLTIGGVAGTGTITDNDNVTISAVTAEDSLSTPGSGDSSVVEGGSLLYTVALSAATTGSTTFSLAASGSAAAADYGSYVFSNGVTYDAQTGNITVPAGVTSFTVTVPTVDDTSIEPAETLVLTVGGVAGTGTITDNDAIAVASLTAEDAATPVGSGDDVVEEGGSLRYTVALNGTTVAPTELSLGTSGTAAPADYGNYVFSNGVTYNPQTGMLTIPAGVNSFTITAPTVDDTSVEAPETLNLTVGGVAATGTITDNDRPAVASVTAEDAATAVGSGDNVVEEGDSLRYTIGLTDPTVAPIELSFAPSGSAAAADYGSYVFSNGVTYDAQTGNITVPAGVTSFTVTVPTVDDTSIEPAETLVLTVGGVAGTGTITDNDAIAVASLTAEDAATPVGSGDDVVEEGGSLRYTVALNGTTVAPTELSLGTSGTAAPADYGNYVFSNGVTYNPQTGMLTIPAGVNSFTITAPTVDDTSVEAPETLNLTVGGVAATGTITDNDRPAVASVTAEDAATAVGSGDNVVEEGDSLRYTIGLTDPTVAPIELSFAPSGSAAAADYGSYVFSNGVTYDAQTGNITVPAGVTSFTVTVPTVDDTSIEPAETLVLTVGGVAGTGTITDNDAIAVASLTAEDAATPVGSGDDVVEEGGSLRYTVALNGTTVAPTELSLGASGTAAPADYGNYVFSNGVTYNPQTGMLTIPAGVNSFTITAPTVDDTSVEAPETLNLTVGGVAATGTITDNDRPAVASVTAEDAATAVGSGDNVVEEGDSLRYTIGLTDPTVAPIELSFAPSGSAAAADYGSYVFSNGVTYDAQTGNITVPAGVTSFTVTVPTVDDTSIEPAETLVLTVGGVAGTGTITDNDAIAVASLTAEDAATPVGSGDDVVEEGGSLRYTVALNGTTVAPTELSLGASGTAAPADYGNYVFSNGVTYNPQTGMLTIPAGVNSFTITAPTVDDTSVEAPETLNLTVGGVAATGTITDNDRPAVASVTAEDAATAVGSGDNVVEEGDSLRYTIGLTDPTVAPIELSFAPSGSAAAADYGSYVFSNGVTYDAQTGNITVPAGVTSFTVTVPTVDDTSIEPAETLVLTVGGVAGTGTITDNDAIAVASLTAEDAATPVGSGDDVVEEGGSLRYTVALNGTTVAPTELSLGASGTAAPADYGNYVFSNGVTYNPQTGMLTIPAGVSNFTVTPPTVDDAAVEAPEALTLTVGGIAASGIIMDNDRRTVASVTAEDASTPIGSGDSEVEEGASLRFTVALDGNSTIPSVFSFTVSGSAIPADYSSFTFSDGVTYDSASGRVTVPPGVNSFSITVPTVDDVSVEDMESISLNIDGIVATGMIADNDAGRVQLLAYYQPFTDDWFYAPEGIQTPYACYELVDLDREIWVISADTSRGEAVHCFLTSDGQTEFVMESDLATNSGGQDLGVIFKLTAGVEFSDLVLL